MIAHPFGKRLKCGRESVLPLGSAVRALKESVRFTTSLGPYQALMPKNDNEEIYGIAGNVSP